MADVRGGRVRGRPSLGWIYSVKMALNSRGMTVEAARQCAKDRKEWRALVHMKMSEFLMPPFCLAHRSFGPPSRALVDYPLERGGMALHCAVGVNCKKNATTENQGAVAWYMG